MDNQKLENMKNNKGFIAALDQSGGSSSKTLKLYGISETAFGDDEELMFGLIHQMRKRVFTSDSFTKENIIGAILFRKTMLSKIGEEYTSEYLWNNKGILSFLKVDKGLEEESNGVKIMKPIDDLQEQLDEANAHNVFGTKMRSVIYSANREGIKQVVDQQFDFAEKICNNGLVPIIEPEVDINSAEKLECEKILKELIVEKLQNWDSNKKIMFKFTIPSEDNLYLSLYDFECVVRVVALSGGYKIDEACDKLSKNNRMIASFSRALLEDLRVDQSKEEFYEKLKNVIIKIAEASNT